MTQEQGGAGGGSMTQAELKALFIQQQQRSGVILTEWASQLPRESFVRYYLLILRDYLTNTYYRRNNLLFCNTNHVM